MVPVRSLVTMRLPEGLNLMSMMGSAWGFPYSLGALVSSFQMVMRPLSQPMARMGLEGCHSMQVGVMERES